jgi:hypothetical protein
MTRVDLEAAERRRLNLHGGLVSAAAKKCDVSGLLNEDDGSGSRRVLGPSGVVRIVSNRRTRGRRGLGEGVAAYLAASLALPPPSSPP